MDHEVRPWKRAFFQWSEFMVQLSWSDFLKSQSILKALGPTLCVNRMWTKENDHAPKSERVDFFYHMPKNGILWKKNKVCSFSCLLLSFTCLHFLLNVSKMRLANLLTTISFKKERINLYMFNVIYMWHVPCVIHWALFATCFTMHTQILEF